VNEKERKN
jgi:hypothetical protein